MATDYGSDVSTFPGGVSPDWTLVEGPRSIAESVLRLWLTERGTLLTDESAGLFLLEYLGAGLADEDLETLARQLELEALGEERVASCIALVVRLGEELRIQGQIVPIEGEAFEFVFTLTADTVAVLLPEAA